MKRNKWLKFGIISIIAFLICLALFFIAFRQDKQEEKPSFIIKENVQVITDKIKKDKIPIAVTENTLIFSHKQNFSKGDIIVSGITDVAPNGYIRKVVDIEKENDKYIVHTENGVLTDVFEEAHIKETFILSESGIEGKVVKHQGFLPKGFVVCSKILPNCQPEIVKSGKLFEFFEDNNSDYQFEKSFSYAINDAVSVDGNVGFDIKLKVELDIEDGNIVLGVTAYSDAGGEIFFNCYESIQQNFEKELFSKNLPNLQFFIGTIPIVITSEVQANLEGEVSVEGMIGTSFEIDTKIVSGFEYDSRTKDVTEIKKLNYLSDGLKWETEAMAKTDNSVGVMLHLVAKLYDSTGADMSIGIQGVVGGEIGISAKPKADGLNYIGRMDLAIEPIIQGSLVVSQPVIDKVLSQKPLFEVKLNPLWEKHWVSGENWENELEELYQQDSAGEKKIEQEKSFDARDYKSEEWYQLYTMIYNNSQVRPGMERIYFGESYTIRGEDGGGVSSGYPVNFTETMFYLKDISSDGIPELFIGAKEDGNMIILAVYSYNGLYANCESAIYVDFGQSEQYYYVYLCSNNALYEEYPWGDSCELLSTHEDVENGKELIIDTNTLDWKTSDEW